MTARLKQILDHVEQSEQSKQLRWQLKQKSLGRCLHCGKETAVGSSLCFPELTRRRLRARKAAGCKEWKKGGIGRPPKFG